jgi:hypothetical protein
LIEKLHARLITSSANAVRGAFPADPRPRGARKEISAMKIISTQNSERRDILVSIVTGNLILFAMLAISVYLFSTYGSVLFILSPLMATMVCAYCYNFHERKSIGSTLKIGVLSLLTPALLMFLFGLEGMICILMAMPFAIVIGLAGSALGYLAAQRLGMKARRLAVAIFVLPMLAGVETATVTPPLSEVVTTMEINAPPEAVWPHVIAYSSLPEPEDLLFRAGVGYPRQVWMEGEGEGSTRFCGFSTGTYVEPITCWAPPYRLTFDVTQTPPAMKELSFYDHVNAPHLDQTPRNRKGEFRLIRLPGNRTRLEGSTWYEIEMYPQFYWQWWADSVVHRVHNRVFAHIKQAAEANH